MGAQADADHGMRFQGHGDGQYNSLWGYNNDSGSVETIPIGSGNTFSPAPASRGQPTSFQPGQNDSVFVVTWNGVGSLTWSLNGHDVSATTPSTACGKNPVSIIGPQTILWGGAIAACAGVILLRRRRRQSASTA
jgi:hypothetical protein